MRLDAVRSSVTAMARRRRAAAAVLVFAAAATLPGCTSQQKQGQSSAYLIVDSVLASRGNEPEEDSGVLDSDVTTGGTAYSDLGKVTLRLALKDPGSITNPATPTSANFITVNRYHVRFIRSDGKNVQGVDVPFEFDGATTVTVADAPVVAVLTLVRAQSKLESPLQALAGLGGSVVISTVAEVTLYGSDQAGRAVSVKGSISVNFADWAD